MGGIRAYTSNAGFTTPTQLSNITPTNAYDLTDKEYVDAQVAGTKVTQTISNNTGPSDVTGLLFSSASYKSAFIKFSIHRKTDTLSYQCAGMLFLYYDTSATSWKIRSASYGDDHLGFPAGVDFSITGAGQVQYTSTDVTGTNYTGTAYFKYTTGDLIEV